MVRNKLQRYFILALALLATQHVNAQTKIGGTAGAGDPSAVLELQSTNQGLLLPRLTTAQRNAISNPAVGLAIYNTTIDCEEIYQGSTNGWYNMCSGGGTLSFTNCGTATVNGVITSSTPIGGVTVTLNYINNTGQTAGAFTSVTSNGITIAAPGGAVTTLANGSGSITLTVSGTPLVAGTTNVLIALAGATCSIPFNVVQAVGNVPTVCNGTINASPCSGGIADPTQAVAGSKICWGGYTYMVVQFGSRLWLDRNLGAAQAATSSRDAASYGDAYQWGRKGDGHQCLSPMSGTTATQATGSDPGNSLFITNSFSPYRWTTSAQYNTYWDSSASGGINNPCPPGFRLATAYEMTANGGVGVDLYSTALKMPFTPNRQNTGSYPQPDQGGRTWLCVPGPTSPYAGILSYSPIAPANVTGTSSIDNGYYNGGYAVRCIKH